MRIEKYKIINIEKYRNIKKSEIQLYKYMKYKNKEI